MRNKKKICLYEEINKIPNTEKDIDNFKYNIYIVTEPVSINALAEKLQTDPNIILYNNPYIIGKDMLQEGDRIILYDDPIVFYRINENDTIEKISSSNSFISVLILKSSSTKSMEISFEYFSKSV